MTPTRGDELPVLDDLTITEATPDPPPGPLRDALVSATAEQAQRDEAEMVAVLTAWLDELAGVVPARLRSPKIRRDTKWWTPEPGQWYETKALDAERVLPDHRVDELEDRIRPVALRIARDSAASTAARLNDSVGDPLGADDSPFAVDTNALDAAIDAVVAETLGVAERHAAEVRRAILDADGSAADLDEVIDRVTATQRRGGAWVLMSGRTLANALRNDAALEQARALGVTHTQWLSRRDARVRPTHRVADGAVRPTGEHYMVGRFRLRYPADPTDLPASWSEVAGCRCGLLFKPPDKAVQLTLDLVAGEREAPDRVRETLARLHADADEAVQMPAPPGLGVPGLPAVALPNAVLGYRMLGPALLDVVPGQLLTLPGPVVLGTAAPMLGAGASADAAVLVVAVPQGTTVGVAGGSIVVSQGTPLSVIAVSGGTVTATLA